MTHRWIWAGLLFALAATYAPARKPRPPEGTLTLDIADPLVTVTVNHVTLRLRVAPDQKRLIELNRAAADRLGLPFEGGITDQVGRETVAAIGIGGEAMINRRPFPAQIISHDRDCCQGADGEIGMTLLPYAVVRFVRAGAPPGDWPLRRFLIEDSDERGPETRLRIGSKDIFALFSLTRPQSVATWSAAVILAGAQNGQLLPGAGPGIAAAFGVLRPTRTLALARPADIAGFGFTSLPVRIADFGGHYDLPADRQALPDDIMVMKRVPTQDAWPAVLIGRDRLDRCTELRFDAIAKLLTLACEPAPAP